MSTLIVMILKPFTVYEEIFLYLFYIIIKAQFMSVIFVHFVNDLCRSDMQQNCWVLSCHIIDSKLTHIFQNLIKSDKKKNWDTVYLCHSFFERNFLSWSFGVKFIFLFNFRFYIYYILDLTLLIPIFDLISSVVTK